MHDLLIEHPHELLPRDLDGYAAQLGLDRDRFWDEIRRRVHAPRIDVDVASADAGGVTGTPTFFVNGRRHHGAYDADTLTRAVSEARKRARAQQGA
jgi:predicted DsbA family dithiol-disulfide isomerase